MSESSRRTECHKNRQTEQNTHCQSTQCGLSERIVFTRRWIDGAQVNDLNWDDNQPDRASEDCSDAVNGRWGNSQCADTGFTGHVCQTPIQ
jgi:hypothetical protein